MKIYKKISQFLEARLSDLVNIKGSGDIVDKINKYQKSEYDYSKDLTRYVLLKNNTSNGKGIKFKIYWNDNATHKIHDRIENRTSFKSTNEFNEHFSELITRIFPEMVGKQIKNTGRYSIYDKENNFSIIVFFDIDQYLKGNYKLVVITIIPGRKGLNVEKILDI